MGAQPSPAGQRRVEDRTLKLIVATPDEERPEDVVEQPGAQVSMRLLGYELGESLQPHRNIEEMLCANAPCGTVLLLDTGTEHAMLVAGAAIRSLRRGSGGDDLLSRARAGAEAWEQEQVRSWRREQLPEKLLAFSEALAQADTVEEICAAVTEHTVESVNGFTALLFFRDVKQRDLAQSGHEAPANCCGRELSFCWHPRFARPGLIYRAEAEPDTGGPFSFLAPVFEQTDAAVLAHVPCGPNGILVLVERRGSRTFEPEDWDLLRAFSSQGSSALERLRLLRELQDSSLTDPLTGLANRRRAGIILDHAWAAAQRGHDLTVAVLDLDNFKEVNDTHGHLAGDRVLQSVAGTLRTEARGADLVARYGGDEFLIVFPGVGVAGADVMIERVWERLGPDVRVSAGRAEYHPKMKSPSELIEAADRDLYRHKRARSGTPIRRRE